MTKAEVNALKKPELVEAYLALQKDNDKQKLFASKMEKKYNEEHAKVQGFEKEVNELKPLRSTNKGLEQQIKDLNTRIGRQNKNQPADPYVERIKELEEIGKAKDKVLATLMKTIDEFMGASGDAISGLKAFVNMTDNAFKNIVLDMNRELPKKEEEKKG